MASPWRNLCFRISGALRATEYADGIRCIEPPPERIPTKRVVVFIIVALSATVIEAMVRSLWAKRKGWRKKPKDYSGVLDWMPGVDKIEDWMEEKGFVESTPTFYEEYLYYKYYNKSGKWCIKRKFIEHLPLELEELEDSSKKNYLTSRLAGLGK